MVEPIMYLAIGFLLSMLFGLMILPLVHNRAVRLTTRRLEAATPISMAEIQADKDQLRAEFAMSARRLEMSVEQLKNKSATQLAELGKKTDAINRMKLELGEKSSTIFSIETREQTVRDQLRATEDEFAAKTESLRTAEAALAEKQAELARLGNELADRSMTADTRQVELLAVRTQIDAMKHRVAGAGTRGDADNTTQDLLAARDQVDGLTQRVRELEASLAMQNKLLAERDEENAQLRREHETAVQMANDTREALAATGSSATPALDRIRTEKTATDEQLRLVTEERGKLQRELNAMQQQAESAWATERMENALLRERINDIAAEVAKLAMTLEGPNSTIEAILAEAPVVSLAPADQAHTSETSAAPRGTLADRIRALQSHASRAREAT